MGTGFLSKQWGQAALFCMGALLALGGNTGAQAQILPDNTLGNETSIVIEDASVQGLPTELIEGGASRGPNLFHSFTEFNIAEFQRVYFANPAGIEAIFSRVTGDNPSDLLGTLGVDGGADLFFLNPNGIVFGANAQLDITGSFFASTADAFEFGEDLQYGIVDLAVPPLLAVTLTPGLQYGNRPQAEISSAGTLQVGATETLSLYGNDVLITGELIAPGGTVQVLGDRVGLFESALVDVSADVGGGTVYVGGAFGGDESLPRANQAVVGPDAVITADGRQTGDGGEIIVWSDHTTQAYGTFSAQGGQMAGDGGLIELSGKLFLDFQGVANTQAPNGAFGTLLLDPTNIFIVSDAEAETNDLALVADATFPDLGGDGDTRLAASALENVAANTNIVLEATNNISFDEDVVIDETRPNVSISANAGNDIVVNRSIEFRGGGNIDFAAGNDILITDAAAFIWTYGGDGVLTAGNEIALTNAAQIDTAPTFGISGNLTAAASTVRLSDGAQFKVGTLSEGGGTLEVIATESVILDGIGTGVSGEGSTGFNANATGNSTGPAGNIIVSSPIINLQNGGAIGTATLGEGAAGDILVQNVDLLFVDDVGLSPTGEEFQSGVFNSTASINSAAAIAGSIRIDAAEILISNGGVVGSSTFGPGNAGVIQIVDADHVEVSGTSPAGEQSGIFARTVDALGDGGNIEIETDQILVKNGGVIEASTIVGQGNGGLVKIIDADRLEVSGTSPDGLKSSIITNSRFALGDGGNIEIEADQIVVKGGGQITSSTILGSGNAGRVQVINAESVEVSGIALDGQPSGIFTRTLASSGSAGTIEIDAEALIIRDLAEISADGNFLGNPGAIDIQSELVLIENAGVLSVSNGSNASGLLTIETDNLSLRDRGSISIIKVGDTSTFAQNKLTIQATELISINNAYIDSAGIAESLGSTGGDIILGASQLEITNGSFVTSSIFGAGTGGDILFEIDDFIEISDSQIVTDTVTGDGRSGDLFISTEDLFLNNLAVLSTSAGFDFLNLMPILSEAGNIGIFADSVIADNFSSIETNSAMSTGGDILFEVNDYILLRRGSNISANALGFSTQGGGDGGNIVTSVPFLVAVLEEDSDISANAVSGSGGRITISARDIIGLEFQDASTLFSDITASSSSGSAGITEFDRLTNVDVQTGLNVLPTNLVDPTSLIDQRCDLLAVSTVDADSSQFTVVGRGGLPTTPNTPLNQETLLDDLGPVAEEGKVYGETNGAQLRNTSVEEDALDTIAEPQGWRHNAEGQLVLYSTTHSTHSPIELSTGCASSSPDVTTQSSAR